MRLKFTFFRRKKSGSIVEQKGAEIRSQRQNERRRVFGLKVWHWLSRHYLVIFSVVIAILIVATLGLVGHFLANSDVLVLEEITITGSDQLEEDSIRSKLEPLLGQSLTSINTSHHEWSLMQEFPFLKAVYIRKIIPNKLEVEIVERFPVMVYLNTAGAFTVDGDRVVVNVLMSEEGIQLTKEDLLLLDGYGDINSPKVRDKYLSDIEDEEERTKVDWEEVEEGDKQRAFAALRDDFRAAVDGRFKRYMEAVLAAELTGLPILEAVTNDVFEAGSLFVGNKYDYTLEISDYFEESKFELKRLYWQSDFNISAEIASGAKVIFTTSRPLEEQLQSLGIILEVEDINKVSVIDVRSQLVSVR